MKEKEILRQRINVGYVFQNFNLFPHLTVLENLIEAPIAHKQVTRKEAIARAYELLDVVGCAIKPTPGRGISPAASSSVSPLPGRWRWTRG
jgi:ABC-type polar amino acid transport system ATPase subunit